MTLFFQSHEITIYRRRRKGNSDRFGYSATFTGYPADIQPAAQERIEMSGGRFGKTFIAFVDSSVDIKESDQVVANGKRYSVKGVSTWESSGLLEHKELILVSQDG